MTKKVGDRDLMFLRFETKLWNRGIKYSRKIGNLQHMKKYNSFMFLCDFLKPLIQSGSKILFIALLDSCG